MIIGEFFFNNKFDCFVPCFVLFFQRSQAKFTMKINRKTIKYLTRKLNTLNSNSFANKCLDYFERVKSNCSLHHFRGKFSENSNFRNHKQLVWCVFLFSLVKMWHLPLSCVWIKWRFTSIWNCDFKAVTDDMFISQTMPHPNTVYTSIRTHL